MLDGSLVEKRLSMMTVLMKAESAAAQPAPKSYADMVSAKKKPVIQATIEIVNSVPKMSVFISSKGEEDAMIIEERFTPKC